MLSLLLKGSSKLGFNTFNTCDSIIEALLLGMLLLFYRKLK